MAVSKIAKWNSVPHTFFGAVNVESSYDVYADMSGGGASPYLRVNNLCIYSSAVNDLTSRAPFTVTLRVNSVDYSFTSSADVSNGGYSAGGTWMQYYISISSDTNIPIPNDGSAFSIRVTLSPRSGAGSYTSEQACGVYPVHFASTPTTMNTGALTSATLSGNVKYGTNYVTTGSFTWFPQSTDYYTTAQISDLFTDPYTKVSSAPSAFNTVYFAVPNGDNLPNMTSLQQNGTLSLQTKFKTNSFSGGSIVISSASAYIKVIPRPATTIDSALKPEANSSGTVIVATPSNTKIGNKYLGGYATLTITPSFLVKYQSGSSPYLRYKVDYKGRSYYSSDSVSIQTTPTYTYNPSTGESTLSMEYNDTFICTVTDQWSIYLSDNDKTKYTITTSMLGYLPPQITNFEVRRCAVDPNGDYTYNGTTYSKNDYGAYCLIEYGVKFTSLDNTNVRHMTIRYGYSTMTINTSSYESTGFVVVPADTERTLEVTIRLWDTYTTGGIYATLVLSTAGVLLDFLNGGKGVAVGKVSESQNVFEINPEWRLLFYRATVGNYLNNSEQDLIAWMHDIDSRLDDLENSLTAN